MDTATKTEGRAEPWNKGKLLGQKPPHPDRLGTCRRIRIDWPAENRRLCARPVDAPEPTTFALREARWKTNR
jgi:hypothetical protein